MLVTGHQGYLGTVMVPVLQAAGHEVVGLDNGYFAECVLGPDPGGQRGAEVAPEGRDQRVHGGDAGHVHLAAALLERRAQILVDDGVQHHARGPGDLLQHAVELTLGTDQGVDVFDRQDVVEARADGAGQRVQGLARGVRHKVDMEVGGEAGA